MDYRKFLDNRCVREFLIKPSSILTINRIWISQKFPANAYKIPRHNELQIIEINLVEFAT